jgi:hypothetical protein
MTSYFEKNFALMRDGKKLHFVFVGYEKEDDAVWVYFENTEKNAEKGSFEIRNTIFIKHIAEQKNILYLHTNDQKKSFIFDARKITSDKL